MDNATITQLTNFANANPAMDKRILKNIKRDNYKSAAAMVADYYQRLANAYRRRGN